MSSGSDKIELPGKVLEVCRGGIFKVEVEMGEAKRVIEAYPSGRVRKFAINIVVGDTVRVEVSPYDLSKGRIVYRNK